MDEKQQAEGERRVKALLIEPLERLGLAKPSTLRKDDFAAMKRELQQKLAYMSEGGLGALREWVEAHPGGKDRDRFPIALHILKQARKIEIPDTGPSPLCLKIFAHDTGRHALEKGHAPELLRHVKAAREWPGSWTMAQIIKDADRPAARLRDIELKLSQGREVSADDQKFRTARRAIIQECEEIRAQGQSGAAA
jgi:hypothetical protein